jgi:hypothetical protein
MNKIKYLLVLVSFILVAGCCNNTDSKSDTWSDEQKAEWTQDCLKMLEANQTFKGVAEDVCDCILTKTSESYTPEEAAKLTREDEQKIWEKCDYSW